MKLGIVGLPNVGKSTLFNALTNAGADCANYPFCTVEPNTGIAVLPDPRLDRLVAFANPKKVTPAVVEVVDIAGLVKGASQGEGLGNRFLAHIREVDAVLHVVRCFVDDRVAHVHARPDPVADIEVVNLELLLADLETVEKRIEKTSRLLKTGDRKYRFELEVYEKVKASLEQGTPARALSLREDEAEIVRGLFLLSAKPVLYVANTGEENPAGGPLFAGVQAYAAKEGAEVIPVCAGLETELTGMDPEEHAYFLQEMGLAERGVEKLIKAGYKLLDLLSFFTVDLTRQEPEELRAWSVKKGTKAVEAAGKVHTDFARGFIKAEIIGVEELLAYSSYAAAREKGLIRIEGRDYPIADGDVVLFRYNL